MCVTISMINPTASELSIALSKVAVSNHKYCDGCSHWLLLAVTRDMIKLYHGGRSGDRSGRHSICVVNNGLVIGTHLPRPPHSGRAATVSAGVRTRVVMSSLSSGHRLISSAPVMYVIYITFNIWVLFSFIGTAAVTRAHWVHSSILQFTTVQCWFIVFSGLRDLLLANLTSWVLKF